MTLDYAIEQNDISKIKKLNELHELRTYWSTVRRLAGAAKTEHTVRRWQCLSEIRYNELKFEYLENYRSLYNLIACNVGGEMMDIIDAWIVGCGSIPSNKMNKQLKDKLTQLKRMYIALHELELM